MNHSSVTKANFWTGLTVAIFGLVAVFWLIPTYVTGANSTSGQLTPGFMPRIAAWCMVGFGAIVAVNNLRVMLGRAPSVAQESEENEALGYGRDEIVNTLLLMAVSGIFVFVLSRLGFVVPTAIVLAFSMYFAGIRHPLLLVAVSIGVPVVLDQLLWNVLQIPLPDFPLTIF